MYRCRRAASPSWSISHPSLTPGWGRQVQVIELPPPACSRPPAPRWPVLASCPSRSALRNQKVDCARTAVARVGTGGGCWPRGWMGASSMSLLRRGDGPPYCSRQHGGLGWHKHGGSPDCPWRCILPCRPRGRGGQEHVSALALGPSQQAWISLMCLVDKPRALPPFSSTMIACRPDFSGPVKS